jgi:nitroimidazol reductase NimA-like FMN-containing flavoprotein (pyridoxamine 5'-phosphate oxidase superfamily)
MKNIDEPIFDSESESRENNSEKNVDLATQIRKLVYSQSFCILSTQGNNQPYGSLIAYAFTEDLKYFFFKTHVATRKYKLLKECPQVALVIDSRCQHLENMTEVEAVTITGKATRLKTGADYELGVDLLRKRHSYLENFMEISSTALFKIKAIRYFHVVRFQEVSQWIP